MEFDREKYLTPKINYSDLLGIVKTWQSSIINIEKTFVELDKIMMCDPEAPIKEAIYEQIDLHRNTIAKLAGDQDGWLEWYHYECNLGKTPMEMKFANGETLLVCGVEDIVDVLTRDKNNPPL